MNDQIKLALIVSLPPTIAAVASLVVSIKNSTKLDVVHELTNSNLTKVKVSLSKALRKIASLEKVLKGERKGV